MVVYRGENTEWRGGGGIKEEGGGVRESEILHSMNHNCTVPSEFEFGGFLFSVGVPKKQRVQSAAKRRPASFLPKVTREGEIGMTMCSKCCAAFLLSWVPVCPALAQTPSTADSNTSGGTAPAALTSPAEQSTGPSTESTASSGSASGTPTPAPADAQPLPMPSMSGPLQTAIPREFKAGPFGKLAVTGILSGMGLVQGNRIPGDKATQWDLSNGQIFLQKTT